MTKPSELHSKFSWIDQVAEDDKLPAAALKVAYALVMRFADHRPYTVEFAAACGLTSNQVSVMLGALKRRGHIHVIARGPGPSEYLPVRRRARAGE